MSISEENEFSYLIHAPLINLSNACMEITNRSLGTFTEAMLQKFRDSLKPVEDVTLQIQQNNWSILKDAQLQLSKALGSALNTQAPELTQINVSLKLAQAVDSALEVAEKYVPPEVRHELFDEKELAGIKSKHKINLENLWGFLGVLFASLSFLLDLQGKTAQPTVEQNITINQYSIVRGEDELNSPAQSIADSVESILNALAEMGMVLNCSFEPEDTLLE